MKKLIVVKIGGNVIDDKMQLEAFLKKFSNIKEPKILVHGGGKLATQLAEQLNIPVQMIEGRRITNSETLKIATMVYAGYINKNIVAQLQSHNCNAIGLSGADGNSIQSNKRKNTEIDYGFVGDLEKVNSNFLNLLLKNNTTPVVSAITHDGKGQLLNTNADTIASAIAVALADLYKVQLIYCFEKNGVLKNVDDESTIVKSISTDEYKTLKSEGVINNGMIPKMDNAFEAIKKKVNAVIIGKSDELLNLIDEGSHAGTRLRN